MLLGPVRVIPREFSFLDTRNIDLDFATRDDKDHHGKSELLMATSGGEMVLWKKAWAV